jgi:hypothetical protein
MATQTELHAQEVLMRHIKCPHPDMDYAEHERTYAGFINLFKAGTISCIMLLIFMAIFLV